MDEKKLGVIGGIGPLATFYFGQQVVKNTVAATDQEHIHITVLNDTKTPDRTAFITGRSTDSPVDNLIKNLKTLKSLDCDIAVMPCNTSHVFYDEITSAVDIPLINMIEITARDAAQRGMKKVVLYATAGTISSGIYQKYLEDYGIQCIIPDEKTRSYVTSVIYDKVKAGLPVDIDEFNKIADRYKVSGYDGIILGCTELSVIATDYNLDKFFVDAMDCLVKESIKLCGKQVKKNRGVLHEKT